MHLFRSLPTRFSILCLIVLLLNGIIRTGRGALQRHPGSQLHPCSHDAQLQHRRQQHCHQVHQQLEQQQQQYQANAAYLYGISGGSSANSRRRRQHTLSGKALGHEARRRPHAGEDHALPGAIEVSGADLGRGAPHLDGVYLRESNADINGAPHFKKRSKRGSRSPPVHLFFTGHEWMLHLDANSELDVNHCLAYSEVSEIDPLKTTRRWAVRVGQAWVRRPHMRVAEATADDLAAREDVERAKVEEPTRGPQEVISGVEGNTIPTSATYNSPTATSPPMGAGDKRRASSDAALNRRLLPLYLVFVLDAVGLGVALPVLPFYVMGLRATALQLAVVVSSNYIAQTFGCIVTGNLSDVVGRKPVMIGCLLGNVISNVVVARSETLAGVAWGRIIGGVTGGLTPIAQAAVADVVPVQSLPKFLGRIQACVGLGFVLGPMTMTILHRLLRVSNGDTFYAAALFPLAALLYAVFRVSETKVGKLGAAADREVPEGVPLGAEIESGFVPQGRGSRSSIAAESAAETLRTEGLRRRGRYRKREQPSDSVVGQGDEHWVGPVSDEIAEMVDGDGDSGVNGDGDLAMFDIPAVDGGVGSGLREGRGEVLEETEASKRIRTGQAMEAARARETDAIPRAVMLLVGNGFLLMYAFSIETIYAMFLKDNFGYGEAVLSMVFALNGVAVGALQLLGMRHLVRLLGKHVMLIAGNVFLAAGMVGVALSRNPVVHFALFTVHIMGYSLADTALVALISRYSSPATQGRSLGLNQAAQSMARVVSPVVAGVLYEWSKRRDSLPLGALPYLVGATFPLVGVAVPFWLYFRSVEAKKRIGVCTRRGGSPTQVGRGVVAESTGTAFASETNL